MTRDKLIELVTNTGNFSKAKIINWIAALPRESLKINPIKHKVGDVHFHQFFNHPIVIIRIKGGVCTCVSLTSSGTRGVLEACQSRFFNEAYFTKTLIMINTEEMNQYSFMGTFDNNKQIREVKDKLLNIISQ